MAALGANDLDRGHSPGTVKVLDPLAVYVQVEPVRLPVLPHGPVLAVRVRAGGAVAVIAMAATATLGTTPNATYGGRKWCTRNSLDQRGVG
jgi:hypothetical protein